MRLALGAFGLVGLLVVVGIMLYTQAYFISGTAPQIKAARSQAQQLSGRDANGRNVMDQVVLEGQDSGGQFRGLKVKQIVTGGELEQHFGLQVGDEIVGTDMEFRSIISDQALARDLVLKAYQENRQITVLRNGQRLQLPPEPGKPAGGGAGTPGGATGGRQGNPLQDQLDAIRGPR